MFLWQAVDPLYWFVAIIGLIIGLWATIKTQTAFAKYSRYFSRRGITGAEAARMLLESNDITGVSVERVGGFLSDHYDPITKTLRLSPQVYDSTSLAAIGVACHEAGHAIQHANGYIPMYVRSAMVPVVSIGSYAWGWILFLGVLMQSFTLIKFALYLFGAVVLFTLITLPVEWNASSRAKKYMISTGIVDIDEAGHASAVLNAAFMTYVASAVTAILTFLYYLLRFGLIGGRRDD